MLQDESGERKQQVMGMTGRIPVVPGSLEVAGERIAVVRFNLGKESDSGRMAEERVILSEDAGTAGKINNGTLGESRQTTGLERIIGGIEARGKVVDRLRRGREMWKGGTVGNLLKPRDRRSPAPRCGSFLC